MIENSLGALRMFHRLGAPYMTLSHFGSNDWADAATDRPIYDNGRSSMAYGLEDVTRFPVLIAELLRRDYTEEEVKKIAGLNLIRAMREMEQVAARLQRER